ncbi:hypothetical protein B5181_26095 [Streptomyces sp. 4F]|nr:hypothetical protein B5181_26095 [Streptomyces sp. 4F]
MVQQEGEGEGVDFVLLLPHPGVLAQVAGNLGSATHDVTPEPDRAVPVDVPALGTAAVVLHLRSPGAGGTDGQPDRADG